MYLFSLYFCTYIFISFSNASRYKGWGYINVHCRNNDNAPLPWWYIYKPPSNQIAFLDRGINFTYISPEMPGGWQVSKRFLTDGSMLQHTLSPIFKSTYVDYVAVVAYEDRVATPDSHGSGMRGVLLADELGGVWMTHTIRGFPDFTASRPIFPAAEIQNGHLITCLSLDLLTLNEVLKVLINASPNFTLVHVPERIASILPDWINVKESRPKPGRGGSSIEFVQDQLRVMVLSRKSGERKCLYRQFAKSKNLILDVYNPSKDDSFNNYCNSNFGVRRIPQISMKIKDAKVFYIPSEMDKSKFGVSTFAHWQQTGSGPEQQWTCTSNLHLDDDTKRGGHILCVDFYDLWYGFDNLKVKEPTCEIV